MCLDGMEPFTLRKIQFCFILPMIFQMFNFKLKVSDARKAWMKSPEKLENCSVGFYFPHNSEEKALVSVDLIGLVVKMKLFIC